MTKTTKFWRFETIYQPMGKDMYGLSFAGSHHEKMQEMHHTNEDSNTTTVYLKIHYCEKPPFLVKMQNQTSDSQLGRWTKTHCIASSETETNQLLLRIFVL
jgi:hypothetical protein